MLPFGDRDMDGRSNDVIDRLTVAAIAALAYVLTAFFHEGVGHGGMCLAVGGHPSAWGAYYFDCDTRGLPASRFRLVAAAGSTVDLILCGVFAALFAQRVAAPGPKGAWTLFLWIVTAVNGLTWAGYFMFSGLADIGDWSTAADGVLGGGLSPGVVISARIAMVVGGVLAYLALSLGAGRMLARLVGGGRADRARRVAFTTYIAGGVTAVLISLANPIGLVITILSAAASSLGGTAGLFWTVRMMPKSTVAADWSLPRSWPWIAVGGVAVAVYAVVWGPSLRFAHA